VDLEDFVNGYAIDIFIGSPELWGKGIGSKAIIALKQYLFNELKATMLFADPEETNIRSIRCWEKAGFNLLRKFLIMMNPIK
jgi:aminoglycoside 6'-N-acetyltransferase